MAVNAIRLPGHSHYLGKKSLGSINNNTSTLLRVAVGYASHLYKHTITKGFINHGLSAKTANLIKKPLGSLYTFLFPHDAISGEKILNNNSGGE
ncbi:hypothetical protein ACJJID_09960 [Microbulbifer sp. CnH-101-G]|uniref:hypothetical protein n=1 Tax=Microbulbifer sp. CnH-101-G TaxID=3243393 RepID=UPI004039D744